VVDGSGSGSGSSSSSSSSLMVTQIYEIRSEIWVATPVPKFGGPKTSNFDDFVT